MTNESIAEVLDRVAELLAAQDANPFRVGAYRRASATLREMTTQAADVLDTAGLGGLAALPGIGVGLSRAIAELLSTGRLGYLDRLRGEASPESLFATVPGIGPALSTRIHEDLGVETLEELESAAHDGRLARVDGFGARRLRAVSESLAGRLASHTGRARTSRDSFPSVAELLDVDREYREKAERGVLRTIAPRRFNPDGDSWLPILHTARADRHYTALFSNTGRAHELGKTGDWVVLFFDEGNRERQATVVTETSGPLRGMRVVRGHELACSRFYDQSHAAPRSDRSEPARTLEH